MSKRLLQALAATTLVTLTAPAQASPELDRQFALETVGCLRAWDNMDGVFGDYVAAAFRDYFSRQSRFVLQDISKADPVLTGSKIPFNKVIEDPEILSQLARVSRSQTLIRTKIQKEGPQYRFTLTWLHEPKSDVLGRDEFVLQEKEGTKAFGQDEFKEALQASLDRMIRKIPYLGAVTGRDNNSVTVNIGKGANLKPGDTLVIGTLDEVKRHPLLKEIVDWRMSATGKLVVDQVEDGLAFCHLIEEEPGRQVARYQKILQIQSKVDTKEPSAESKEDRNPFDPGWTPTLGWVSASAWTGSYSRQFSNTDTIAKSGSGLLIGSRVEGQLWLTKDWFAELGFGYGFWKYSQEDLTTGTPTTGNISGSAFEMSIAGGYSYMLTGDPYGPKGWFKAGYHSISYSLPIVDSEKLAPSSFKGLFVGVGGDLPFRGNWGGLADFQFGFFPGASETGGTSGDAKSATDVRFYIGAYYRWNPRLTLRGAVYLIGNSANFASTSLSEKIVGIAPSLLYYF